MSAAAELDQQIRQSRTAYELHQISERAARADLSCDERRELQQTFGVHCRLLWPVACAPRRPSGARR